MKKGVYIGKGWEGILPEWEGALIQESDKEGTVLVQFDSFYLYKDGESLAHNWHEFPESDFLIDEEGL